MTEAELLSLESEIGRMKAELHIGEKCKLLIAQVRHLRTATVAKPTIEQVQAAQAFMTFAETFGTTESSVGGEIVNASRKAVAILDAFFSR